ncbi:hypothetical protein Goshw_006760 [Gossypium schwendimanii]|uniref:DUF7745 domain-containing protein n=1 Tax=Gossypium schwendimanii TaxID=34291 RepID=A0A7J9MZW3_GOSSC|nr:hypothetical protein [Gossypium schwendimanii]
MKEIWDQWDEEVRQLFYSNYGDLPYLLDMKDASRQSLLESCKSTDLSKKFDEHNRNLKNVVLVHPDVKKRVDVFALSVYGLVIFPKALGHVDEAVTDLFDRLDKGVTPVPAILAKTFRSLNVCRRAGEGRFVGCAQLLLAWFHSHF